MDMSNFVDRYLKFLQVRSIDRDLITRNERMIQFYIVLYGLLLSSGNDLLPTRDSYLMIVLFLMVAICYYDSLGRIRDVNGSYALSELCILNFIAFFVSLLFSLSVQLHYAASLNWSVYLFMFDGVGFVEFSSIDWVHTSMFWCCVLLMVYIVYKSLRL